MFIQHNFDFILNCRDDKLGPLPDKFKEYLLLAEFYYSVNYDVSILYCRRAIEYMIHDIYISHNWLDYDDVAYESTCRLIKDSRFSEIIDDDELVDYLIRTLKIANGAAHQRYSSQRCCRDALLTLFIFTKKYLEIKGVHYLNFPFDEHMLATAYHDNDRVAQYIDFAHRRPYVADIRHSQDPYRDEMRMLENYLSKVEEENEKLMKRNKELEEKLNLNK